MQLLRYILILMFGACLMGTVVAQSETRPEKSKESKPENARKKKKNGNDSKRLNKRFAELVKQIKKSDKFRNLDPKRQATVLAMCHVPGSISGTPSGNRAITVRVKDFCHCCLANKLAATVMVTSKARSPAMDNPCRLCHGCS